ncbi:HAD hydrolase-like protein [Iamia sp. SCSIO 61187]|uniref:HAD hydrolase-like protein n=1 Tax=Iamia sp. SCSIO 61187 TaxID=2722752 RepID=UPI001C6275B3|nr:HAD hydrolase-like protein [Iamia sp. SCSIO 61187]QYG92054.1 HAD hydrolase-like protein [Iamia sp. SCSIO 61187]
MPGRPLPPPPPAAVLFDLDGTLCDSEAGIVEHLGMALATVGLPVPDREVLRSCVGPPWTDGFPPAVGVPAERTWEVIHAYRATYDDAAASLAVPFVGITDVLDRIEAAGIPMAVATSKPDHLAHKIVTEGILGRWMSVVIGADPDGGRHSKADVVGAVLARLEAGVPRAGVVMVGDRLHDVHGAAAHGVPTIGVRWGSAPPGELEEAGAAVVVATPQELGDLLLGAA